MKKKLVCLTLSILMLLSCFVFTGCNTATEEDGDTEVVYNSAKTITMYIPCSPETTEQAKKLVAEEFAKRTKAAFKINVILKFINEDEYYEVLESKINALQEDVLLREKCEKELKAYKKAHKEDKNEAGIKKTTKELEAEFYAENPQYQKFYVVEEDDEDDEEKVTEEETEINEYGIAEIKYPEEKENQVDIFYIGGYDRYVDYYNAEWLACLDEELASGSRKLNSYISPTLLNGVRLDGGVYAIPNNVQIGEYTYMLIDKELFDKYYNKIEDVTTVLDLATFFADMKAENEARKAAGNTEEIVPLASSFEDCLRMLTWFWDLDYVDHTVYNTYFDAETGRNYVAKKTYTVKTEEQQGEGENAKTVEVTKTMYVDSVMAGMLYKTNEDGKYVDKDGNVLDYSYAFDAEGAFVLDAKGKATKMATGQITATNKITLTGMYLVDGEGMPVLPENDKRVVLSNAYVQTEKLDEETGKQMKDDNGNLLYEDKLDADGNPIPNMKHEGHEVIWDETIETGFDADGQPKPTYFYTYADDSCFSILGAVKKNPATRTRGGINLDFNSLFTQAEFRDLYATLMSYSYEGYYGEAGEGKRAAVSFMTGDSRVKLEAEENDGIIERDGKEYYMLVAEYPEASEAELYGNMFAVYGSSNYVSKSMEVLTRLNTNKELRDLLQWGIIGQHYELNDDGTVTQLTSSEADYGTYRMDIEKTGNCFIATPDKDRGADAWTYAKMQNNDSLINPLLGFDFNTEMADSDIGLDVTLIVKIRELNAEAQAEINDCPDLTSLVELMGGSDAGCFVKKFSPSNGDLPKLTKATNGAYDPEQPAGPEVPNQTPDTSGASPYTIYKNWLTNYGYAAKAVVTD